MTKNKIVITSVKKYIDIDAFGGIFAYRKLLRNLGYDAYAVTTAKLNESIPKVIKEMHFQFDEKVELTDPTKFIILDVSNPDFFDTFVKKENIIEIIDHHTGYEKYWNHINIKTQIEFIGSICTILFEKIVEAKKEELLDQDLCKVLIAGILDNTLNLKSSNTTKRDRYAYQELLRIGKINKDWSKTYFHSCYEEMEKNLEESIINDIKVEKTSSLLPEVFGQLIVLQKDTILHNIDKVLAVFREYEEWIFNAISLKDGKSYLFYSSPLVKEKLSLLFHQTDSNSYFILNKCMLRKEIIKLAKEQEKKVLKEKEKFIYDKDDDYL